MQSTSGTASCAHSHDAIMQYVHVATRTSRTKLHYYVAPTRIAAINYCISQLPRAMRQTYYSSSRLQRAQAQMEALFLNSHACCHNELLYSSTPVRSALDIVLYCSTPERHWLDIPLHLSTAARPEATASHAHHTPRPWKECNSFSRCK